MLIPPHYKLTPSITQLLQSIEISKAVLESLTIHPKIEQNIRRQSTLSSALYSARIEGNRLSLHELSSPNSKDFQNIEVFNILKALEKLINQNKRNISLEDILSIHEIVMKDLSPDAGRLRNEVNAIFDSAGVVLYLPPPPQQIRSLLERLVIYINANDREFAPARACLAHFVFEKIHPFMDGNGRAGRLLMQSVLHQYGYGMKGMLPIEEYLDNNRLAYYRYLEEPYSDVTEYLHFMLEALAETAKKTKKLILLKQQPLPEDILLPRRAEIFRIIKDH